MYQGRMNTFVGSTASNGPTHTVLVMDLRQKDDEAWVLHGWKL